MSVLGSKTPMEALLVAIPGYVLPGILCCAAFVHAHNDREQDECNGGADRLIQLGKGQEPYRKYLSNS